MSGNRYPTLRLQRLRATPGIREMLTETRLHPAHLIYPLFMHEGLKAPAPVESMPGVIQHTLRSIVTEAEAVHKLGIPAVLLFGIPSKKDADGSSAWSIKGGVQRAIHAIKLKCPNLVLIADCCLCEYTDHGHCTTLEKDGSIDHFKTMHSLEKIAVSYAEAGVDFVAPSGMLDGMVSHIRSALDQAKFSHVGILSYAVKYASAFYGPFRDAAGSEAFTGNRCHHQMNPAQSREAYREAWHDLDEGADMLMVKPALPYLDILSKLKARTDTPLVAYQVSGEYAMIKAAAEKGWINEVSAVQESLLAIKRAGADLIITYFAKQIAEILNE